MTPNLLSVSDPGSLLAAAGESCSSRFQLLVARPSLFKLGSSQKCWYRAPVILILCVFVLGDWLWFTARDVVVDGV